MKLIFLKKTVLRKQFWKCIFNFLRVPSSREREVIKGVLLSFLGAEISKSFMNFFRQESSISWNIRFFTLGIICTKYMETRHSSNISLNSSCHVLHERTIRSRDNHLQYVFITFNGYPKWIALQVLNEVEIDLWTTSSTKNQQPDTYAHICLPSHAKEC